ncbi:4-hydroxythreonine-4-phosphate dehydrogenase PdxA [Anaerocolumna aminovalerica]|uniref:4-hydroxythreonine-4-phosphate dehydrogenase PdxA n=1 Tax=Anaerocolumna aminovalerica TaxID=1527 RepID=UPI00248BB725|nr:4-hydroxythreonine-4-phosphate dehydrogenase PdxA [Anaerocolumna aminovalerica]
MRPLIAIPIGDPAGIGPEIVVKAIINKEVLQAARCVVIGDKNIIEDAIGFTKVPLKVNVIEHPEDGIYEEGILNLIDLHNVDMTEFRIGEIRGICGKAAYEYIAKSIELANAREVDAVSTTPINKESLKAGGIPYIGHTEIFGALTGTKDPLTMFEVHGMRVFFLSRHVSLRQACNMVKKERIIDYVIRCKEVLATLGVKEGTMAVAGLNPHSGENGLFGNEEVEEVMPAVEELQRRGYDVAGPIGADSVFHLALQGRYNSVLSMYHDQGHIATKTLDFEKTIAVTGGMPILRTSVDHGTAMDIAGKGIASEVSMIEAILLGAKYSPNFTGA